MTTVRSPGRNPAVRAEPRGIGTSGARDPLAREVKLLGALLGQVIVEQQGEAFLDLVERVRRATIEQRRTGSEAARRAVARELDAIDLASGRGPHPRVLALLPADQPGRGEGARAAAAPTRPDAAPAATEGTISAAVRALRGTGASAARGRARWWSALSIDLVLTAHPTEARRRTTLVALRRCYRLLEQLDDPRLTQAEDAEVGAACARRSACCGTRRRCACEAPSPLDEVRSVMAFFDESLFVIAPRLYRELDLALDADVLEERHVDAGTRRGGRQRPVRDASAAHRAVPALGVVGRRRPRRQPQRHRRHHARGDAHPGRPRAARLRGRGPPADADRRGDRARGATDSALRGAPRATTPRSCRR